MSGQSLHQAMCLHELCSGETPTDPRWAAVRTGSQLCDVIESSGLLAAAAVPCLAGVISHISHPPASAVLLSGLRHAWGKKTGHFSCLVDFFTLHVEWRITALLSLEGTFLHSSEFPCRTPLPAVCLTPSFSSSIPGGLWGSVLIPQAFRGLPPAPFSLSFPCSSTQIYWTRPSKKTPLNSLSSLAYTCS